MEGLAVKGSRILPFATYRICGIFLSLRSVRAKLFSAEENPYSIAAKSITYTTAAANKTYDGNTTAATTLGSLTGLVGTETVTASGTAAFNSKDVLAANLVTVNSATLADGANGGLASNYAIVAGGTAAAGITAKSLGYSASAAGKAYDGNTTAAATLGSLTGLVGSETVTASGTATFNSEDVLTANLVTVNTAALADGSNGGLASNYQIAAGGTAAAGIIAKAATVTAGNATKTYGSTLNFTGTEFTSTGLITGEAIGSVSLVSTGAASAAIVAASPYSVTPSAAFPAAGSGFNASNYNLSYVNGNLTVNPAPLTISANGFGKIVDAVPYAGGNGVLYTGLVNGESINVLGGSLVYGGSSQGAVNVGGYLITPGGLTASNYTISYVDGALLITTPPSTAANTSGVPAGAQAAIDAARQSGSPSSGQGSGGASGADLITIVGAGMGLPDGVQ